MMREEILPGITELPYPISMTITRLHSSALLGVDISTGLTTRTVDLVQERRVVIPQLYAAVGELLYLIEKDKAEQRISGLINSLRNVVLSKSDAERLNAAINARLRIADQPFVTYNTTQ